MTYETINSTTGQKIVTELRHVTDWLAEALSGRRIVNIGQIDESNTKRLNAAVKKGLLVKIKAPWTYIHPYGFSTAIKTHYCPPHYTLDTLRAELVARDRVQANALAAIGIFPEEVPA